MKIENPEIGNPVVVNQLSYEIKSGGGGGEGDGNYRLVNNTNKPIKYNPFENNEDQHYGAKSDQTRPSVKLERNTNIVIDAKSLDRREQGGNVSINR